MFEILKANYNRLRLLDVGVEDPFLFQVVRHGVLRQKRRLQPDLGAKPFTLCVRCISGMVTRTDTSKTRTECRTLYLVVLSHRAPDLVANCAGNIDLEFQN